jgi:cyanophycin synthetase
VPLTLGGKAKFMITNVLAATLASYVWGFKTEDISLSLQTFIPSCSNRTNEYFLNLKIQSVN